MSTLDIRHGDTLVERIIFGDDTWLEKATSNNHTVYLEDEDGTMVAIFYADIPNLIKALNKANELWYTDKEI